MRKILIASAGLATAVLLFGASMILVANPVEAGCESVKCQAGCRSGARDVDACISAIARINDRIDTECGPKGTNDPQIRKCRGEKIRYWRAWLEANGTNWK